MMKLKGILLLISWWHFAPPPRELFHCGSSPLVSFTAQKNDKIFRTDTEKWWLLRWLAVQVASGSPYSTWNCRIHVECQECLVVMELVMVTGVSLVVRRWPVTPKCVQLKLAAKGGEIKHCVDCRSPGVLMSPPSTSKFHQHTPTLVPTSNTRPETTDWQLYYPKADDGRFGISRVFSWKRGIPRFCDVTLGNNGALN